MTDVAAFTCPRCSATSWNPVDVAEGYCGRCHDWTGGTSRGRFRGRSRSATFVLGRWADVATGTVIRLDSGDVVEVMWVTAGEPLANGGPGQLRVWVVGPSVDQVCSVWPTSEVWVAVSEPT